MNGIAAPWADQQISQQRLHRRARRRILTDSLILAGQVLLAASFGATAHDGLLLALIAAAFGIMVFIVRRSHDFAALARADRWREEALDGRGLSLEDWRAGASLPSWSERRDLA